MNVSPTSKSVKPQPTPWDEWDAGCDSYGGEMHPPLLDIHTALAPLLKRLEEYDKVRLVLEKEGGSLAMLDSLKQLLSESFRLDDPGRSEVSLSSPQELRRLLSRISWTLRLEIRRTRSCMASYLLCRVSEDYWGEYSLVVEDLYLSPGYPIQDERFVRLMTYSGKEAYHIRLSQLRSGVMKLSGYEKASSVEVDSLLHRLGRHVFQAAWHEDQRLAFAAASHLVPLPSFCNAIELLYLSLGGDLCELRAHLGGLAECFAPVGVYPQPALHRLITGLPGLTGAELADFPKRATELYGRLSKAFAMFLQCQVPWGLCNHPVPVWKILYGNFSRLSALEELRQYPELVDAASELEAEAIAVTEELLTVGTLFG